MDAHLLGIIVIAAAGWRYATRTASPTAATTASPMSAPSLSSEVRPTVVNTTPPPGVKPEGMAWIPGGEFSMGAAAQPGMNDVGMQATTDSRPFHQVYVDGFWMDATEVTNEQFAKFVAATQYVTVAERTPRAEDFPGASPADLVAGAVVFSPPSIRSRSTIISNGGGMQRGELAPPGRPREQPRGPGSIPGRADCL